MHKIFAKPVFLGKKVIFLPQCHSTNDELSLIEKKQNIPVGTVVYTDHQLSGKGQRGNSWVDEEGKSILCSLLLRPKTLAITDSYLLNVMTGVALVDMLKEASGLAFKLKWPNDIYLGEKKIAGILIENSVRGAKLDSSIVGVGININQTFPDDVPATSLSMELAIQFDRYSLLEDLLVKIEGWYRKLVTGNSKALLDRYHQELYWRNELHRFRSRDGEFNGVIQGINEQGRLVLLKEGMTLLFDIKEIEFLR